MQLERLSPKPGSKKPHKRKGRGIAAGQGASCGKGMRGQNSRSGTGTRPGSEGGQMPLYRRLPKLKHFPLVNDQIYTTVNVKKLASLPANTTVTLEQLMKVGIITSNDGPLKILGDGWLKVPLEVHADGFTLTASIKIRMAGGRCIQNNANNRAKTKEEAVNLTLISELDKYKNLKKNWDSYGADIPNQTAIDIGKGILDILTFQGISPDTVVPSSQGGIAICFVQNNKYADIECFNTGEILAGTTNCSNSKQEPDVWEIDNNPQSMLESVKKIQQYLVS